MFHYYLWFNLGNIHRYIEVSKMEFDFCVDHVSESYQIHKTDIKVRELYFEHDIIVYNALDSNDVLIDNIGYSRYDY